MSDTAVSESISGRIQAEFDRALQRVGKGLDYLASEGPTVGATPRDVLHRRGTLALYHYRPLADELYRVPALLVMAPTNRGYIFDLTPGQSLVEFLLRQGYDLFVVEWNDPRPQEKKLRLEDYTLDFLPDCVRRVQKESGEDDVTLIGYCMGGVFSTIYSALHAGGPVKNLAVFTTPIDFSQMKLFHKWSDKRYFDVDRVDRLPGQRAARDDPELVRHAAPRRPHAAARSSSGTSSGTTSTSSRTACSTAGPTTSCPCPASSSARSPRS